VLKEVDRETRSDTLVESRIEGEAIVAKSDEQRVHKEKRRGVW